MTILLFSVAGDGHEGAEEGTVPDVDEGDGNARIDAEDPNAGEGRQHAGHETQKVRDTRHGDGDGGVAHRSGRKKKRKEAKNSRIRNRQHLASISSCKKNQLNEARTCIYMNMQMEEEIRLKNACPATMQLLLARSWGNMKSKFITRWSNCNIVGT